jgi:hypothetical protein
VIFLLVAYLAVTRKDAPADLPEIATSRSRVA